VKRKRTVKKDRKRPKSKQERKERARILLLIEAHPKWTNQQVGRCCLKFKRMIENTKKEGWCWKERG